MAKASRTFVHHYAGVAIVVGLLSSFGTWTATRFVAASSAQPAPAAAKPLLVQPLADLPGREVRIALLDRAPGSSSPPHRRLRSTPSPETLARTSARRSSCSWSPIRKTRARSPSERALRPATPYGLSARKVAPR